MGGDFDDNDFGTSHTDLDRRLCRRLDARTLRERAAGVMWVWLGHRWPARAALLGAGFALAWSALLAALLAWS